MVAVGQAAIDLTPLPVKDFAISTFGANDKNALLAGILVVLAAFAAVIGILAVRRLALGLLGLAIFAGIGLAAALTRPSATAEYAIPTLVGAAAGAFALTRLVRSARGLTVRRRAPALGAPPAGKRRLRAQRAAGPPGLRTRRPRRAQAARLACSGGGPGGCGILLHLPAQPG